MIIAVMDEEGLLPSELADKTAQDRATTTGLLAVWKRWMDERNGFKIAGPLRGYLTSYEGITKKSILKLLKKQSKVFKSLLLKMSGGSDENLLNRLEQPMANT